MIQAHFPQEGKNSSKNNNSAIGINISNSPQQNKKK